MSSFAAQILISFLVTLSIVASGLLLANAQKESATVDANKAPVSQPKEAKSTGKSSTSALKESSVKPAQAAQTPPKNAPIPLLMELSTTKDMYHQREEMMVKAELWALEPVTLCLYPGHPEANFSADVIRAGYGKLANLPNVVQLSPEEMMKVERVQLDAGQMHRIVFNLKKVVPLPPSFWKTGEYRAQVKFFLCGKTEQGEREIPSQGPLHFLVLE